MAEQGLVDVLAAWNYIGAGWSRRGLIKESAALLMERMPLAPEADMPMFAKGPSFREGARALLRAIRDAPPVPELYRGHVEAVSNPGYLLEHYSPGGTSVLPPVSFTPLEPVARRFADQRMTELACPPGHRLFPFIIRLLPGAKAIPVADLAREIAQTAADQKQIEELQEHLTAGMFRVVDRSLDRDRFHLTVEQVGLW
jgi:hypothetical protein